jgi:hypothetical protein
MAEKGGKGWESSKAVFLFSFHLNQWMVARHSERVLAESLSVLVVEWRRMIMGRTRKCQCSAQLDGG